MDEMIVTDECLMCGMEFLIDDMDEGCVCYATPCQIKSGVDTTVEMVCKRIDGDIVPTGESMSDRYKQWDRIRKAAVEQAKKGGPTIQELKSRIKRIEKDRDYAWEQYKAEEGKAADKAVSMNEYKAKYHKTLKLFLETHYSGITLEDYKKHYEYEPIIKKHKDDVDYWKGQWESAADECYKLYEKCQRTKRELKRLKDEK